MKQFKVHFKSGNTVLSTSTVNAENISTVVMNCFPKNITEAMTTKCMVINHQLHDGETVRVDVKNPRFKQVSHLLIKPLHTTGG